MQLFPERLWQSSELGLGDKLSFSAFESGVSNSKLVMPSVWQKFLTKQILKLPVITLEDFSMKRWAKVVAGCGSIRTPGFALDLEFVAEQIKHKSNLNTPEISPENLVDRFLATASPTAQRLAGLMAAAPVSLPVVNLIQKTFFLPNQSTPVNVAEVFLSGMIQRIDIEDKGQNPQYDFVPEVRKILNRAIRLDETENVLDVVSTYIAENLGSSIKSFTALLLSYQELSQEQQEKMLPFATVTLEVLQNLGGEYAEFAEEVVRNTIVFKTETENKQERTPEPELKLETCSFEVATIEIEETHTFEFNIAVLERQNAQWVIKRQKQQATGIIEVLEEGIQLELMKIPEGTFIMGSPTTEIHSYKNEKPQHKVQVPSFYMGRYPITQAQWRVVAGWEQVERNLEPDPSYFKKLYEDHDRWTRPVEGISWYDAQEFCARLSKKTGKIYRLPTEAEWEYACRSVIIDQVSGINEELTDSEWNEKYHQPFHFGETITTDLANYNGNYTYGEGTKGIYQEQTTPVGYFQVANAFGLYDMHGNVWEWCEDDWHNNYELAPTNGSAWLSGEKSSTKVVRGGSWYTPPFNCRSAIRNGDNPDPRSNPFGLRVVCVLPRTLLPSAL